VLDEYAALVESGQAAEEGWPPSINIASKIGQVAAVRILARMQADEARARGILINAACPGLIDTDASRQHPVILPFRGEPLTAQNRTDG